VDWYTSGALSRRRIENLLIRGPAICQTQQTTITHVPRFCFNTPDPPSKLIRKEGRLRTAVGRRRNMQRSAQVLASSDERVS
jgi:hypothetical protein